MVDSFQFSGQADGGVVPLRNPLLVLDTNVISALHSVAKRGFNLRRARDRRVAHLLRWLDARPEADVFSLFGIIEGAGFHAGRVSRYGIVQRALAVVAVIGYGRQHGGEWISSGEPLPELMIPDRAVHPREAIDAAEMLLPWTVLPCYVAALAAARAEHLGKEALEAADFVHERLVEDLDFIPIFGWLTTALLFLGGTELRRELRQRLFKFQRPDIRMSCLSAAWDLGYLQLLSIARSPTLAPLVDGRTPVLVTDDRHLSPTSILALCVGDSPAFELHDHLFDARWRDEAFELLEQHRARRLWVPGRPPDWDVCVAAAGRLERELEIAGAPTLSVRSRTLTLEVSREQMLAFVGLLRVRDASAVVTKLVELGEDIHAAGLVAVARLVEDNARARGRSIGSSWDAIAARLPTGWQQSSTAVLTLKMTKAMADGDWELLTAWREKLALDEMDGFVLLWLWSFGRAILADTAEDRGEHVDMLVTRLVHRLQSDRPPSTQPPGSGGRVVP